MNHLIAFLVGWLADLILGDPAWLPHPVVGFGKLIAAGEKRWNRGENARTGGGRECGWRLAWSSASFC